jgi:hypothetical protein
LYESGFQNYAATEKKHRSKLHAEPDFRAVVTITKPRTSMSRKENENYSSHLKLEMYGEASFFAYMKCDFCF